MKVLILGSSGFVGRNIAECLSENITIIKTSRKDDREKKANEIYFDFFNRESWENIINASPDIIINAAAYGVVKLQTDPDTMYKTNYFLTSNLYDYIYHQNKKPYWLQLGTAFEYDLLVQDITEESPCLPRTHYGVSKLMMSNYLLTKGDKHNFSIVRPFGMFGKYEDESKFFPYLISAQRSNIPVDLSPGTQRRDYIYVADLGHFINKLLAAGRINSLPPVLNIGSGKAISFREYASVLQTVLPSFNPDIWKWGKKDFRQDESDLFYSASQKAVEYGFVSTRLEESFIETVKYYLAK